MKVRYIKMYGVPYYTKEVKRFPWSVWQPYKNDIGQILPYRYYGGEFVANWEFEGPDNEDIEFANNN